MRWDWPGLVEMGERMFERGEVELVVFVELPVYSSEMIGENEMGIVMRNGEGSMQAR